MGGGKSSRALIRKGQWSIIEKMTNSGHVLIALDENSNQITEKANLWIDGHSYTLENGGFYVPFTSSPRSQTVVITCEGFSSLGSFYHQCESYSLSVSFYVDREQILANKKAKVLIRAQLLLHSAPVPLSLLHNTTLTLSSADQSDTPSNLESEVKLYEDKDTLFEFQGIFPASI